MTGISRQLLHGAAGLASLLLFLALWEALARALHVRPIMLPLPTQIAAELATDWRWYAGHAWYTLLTTMGGFLAAVVGGVLTAVLLVGSRWFESVCYPLIVALNSVPKVAVAPLFVIWLGTGAEPKIAIAFLIAVFAIVVDTVHGLKSVPQDVLDLGRVLKGSRRDFFFKVRLPAALPSIVTGMKVAISLALVGAIVGEFVSSQRGLGYVIMSAQGTFDTVRVFAALFVLALMGMALFGLLAWLERKATPWRRRDGGH
ncbi:ABC transporter permease [Bordetella petrii]|uniref:ABC transporter permease n=1 Tax=Bordetella petrii TaxID=94624 RepID=A0ABT7W2Y3_9BORD|nr:ABC transporter permease [Bordetella petrii]MDM9559510.1 ABC transporter permease [Bordetella petrii]